MLANDTNSAVLANSLGMQGKRVGIQVDTMGLTPRLFLECVALTGPEVNPRHLKMHIGVDIGPDGVNYAQYPIPNNQSGMRRFSPTTTSSIAA